MKIALLLCVLSFVSYNAFCDDIPNQKKSYAFAIAGSLLLPAIGHSYIGGDNTRRGLYYTGGELVILFRLHTLKNDSILPCGNISPEGGRGDEKGSHCFAFDT
ncbi:MAG: hypothetical protein Q8O92_07325 [Candidatus Latescibacter sp.]|nr:hypothetical protein [Candidatus Latescibacter sp.]